MNMAIIRICPGGGMLVIAKFITYYQVAPCFPPTRSFEKHDKQTAQKSTDACTKSAQHTDTL